MHGWPELVMKTGRVYTISDNEGIRHWLPKKADVKYIYCNDDLFFALDGQNVLWNKSDVDMAIPRRMLSSLTEED